MRTWLVAVLAACGGSQPAPAVTAPPSGCSRATWSCIALRPGGGDPWGCRDGDATQQLAMQATCTPDRDGQFASGSCPRDLALAGCMRTNGATCTTMWFWKGGPTRAEIESDCARQGGTVVTP